MLRSVSTVETALEDDKLVLEASPSHGVTEIFNKNKAQQFTDLSSESDYDKKEQKMLKSLDDGINSQSFESLNSQETIFNDPNDLDLDKRLEWFNEKLFNKLILELFSSIILIKLSFRNNSDTSFDFGDSEAT